MCQNLIPVSVSGKLQSKISCVSCAYNTGKKHNISFPKPTKPTKPMATVYLVFFLLFTVVCFADEPITIYVQSQDTLSAGGAGGCLGAAEQPFTVSAMNQEVCATFTSRFQVLRWCQTVSTGEFCEEFKVCMEVTDQLQLKFTAYDDTCKETQTCYIDLQSPVEDLKCSTTFTCYSGAYYNRHDFFFCGSGVGSGARNDSAFPPRLLSALSKS